MRAGFFLSARRKLELRAGGVFAVVAARLPVPSHLPLPTRTVIFLLLRTLRACYQLLDGQERSFKNSLTDFFVLEYKRDRFVFLKN